MVLTGTGRAFCVGQDLKEHVTILQDSSSDALFRTVPEHYNPIVTALATMPKPVVAAVNGVAAGAGASLAFACDFRVLADSAGFNLAFSRHRALLRHRVLVDAAEAGRPGQGARAAVLPAHHPRRRGARRWAWPRRWCRRRSSRTRSATLSRRLADGPTVSFGAIRRSVEHSAGHDFESSLAFEAEMMALTGATQDHHQAVDAFVAKQKPIFEGR